MGNSELGFRKFLGGIIPDITNTFRRFPAEVLIAALLTVFFVFALYEHPALDLTNKEIGRTLSALVSAFLWTLAVNLRGQRYNLQLAYTIPTVLVGIGIIALLHIFHALFQFHFILFVPALLLSVGLLAYIGKETDERAFWLFNHRIWVGAVLALIGALIFAGGLSLTVASIIRLFSIPFYPDVYKDIWTVGMGFIFPLSWLSFIPSDFEEKVPEGEQTEFTSSAIAVIVKFTLIPLLLVYTAILYAYAIRIGIIGQFPKGFLGSMVLAYGLIGAIGILFVYPTRKSGGPVTHFFWRYWFMLTIVPVILLTMALFQRVFQYGFTTERYIVWMAGLWLAYFAVAYSFSREHRNFRLMIGVLSTFMLLASFGPWGARGVGVTNQVVNLKILLTKNGILKDGLVKPLSPEDSKKLSLSDLKRIKSIVRYLSKEDALDRIGPAFRHVADAEFPLKENNSAYVNAGLVLKWLGVTHVNRAVLGEHINYRISSRMTSLPLKGYDLLAGPINTSRYKSGKKVQSNVLGSLEGREVKARYTKNAIELKIGNSSLATINIHPLMKDVARYTSSKTSDKTSTSQSAYVYKTTQNGFEVSLIVEDLYGTITDTKVKSYSIKTWILIDNKK